MTTNFPSSVDAFTNPTSNDTLDNPPHDQQHADINDAMEAVQTSLLDGSPLRIDDANNRVGIGTATPTDTLDVNGTLNVRDHIDFSDTTPDAANRLAIYPHGYDLYVDNAGAGADNTRLWLNTPDEGEVVIGPRSGSSTLGNMRIRSDDISLEGAVAVTGDMNAGGYARTKGKALGMAYLGGGSLSGGATNFSNYFSGDWQHYRIVVDAAQNGSGGWTFFKFINSSGTAISSGYYSAYFLNGTFLRQNNQTAIVAIYSEYYAYGGMIMDITLPYNGDHPSIHISSAGHQVSSGYTHSLWAHGYCATTDDLTGFQFYNGSPYGAVRVFGYGGG